MTEKTVKSESQRNEAFIEIFQENIYKDAISILLREMQDKLLENIKNLEKTHHVNFKSKSSAIDHIDKGFMVLRNELFDDMDIERDCYC